MPKKRYIVTLTAEERTYLYGLISKGKAAAFKQRHARMLLKTDQGPQGEGWTDDRIEHALDVHASTVERLRKRFVEEGLEAALQRKEQKNRKAKKLTVKRKPISSHLPAVSRPRVVRPGPCNC